MKLYPILQLDSYSHLQLESDVLVCTSSCSISLSHLKCQVMRLLSVSPPPPPPPPDLSEGDGGMCLIHVKEGNSVCMGLQKLLIFSVGLPHNIRKRIFSAVRIRDIQFGDFKQINCESIPSNCLLSQHYYVIV